jgi:hypothetical protein
MLLKQIYYIFIDNLFLIPPLFYKLYNYRYRAIGIACPNYSIYKDLKRDKALDKLGHYNYTFNKVRAILIRDNKVRSYNTFLYISLTNLSFPLLYRLIN